MTREELIKKKALDYSIGIPAECRAFIAGAMWADKNPQPVHIVMRCEEHSDYPERVFVDKAKADAYCRQFDDNPNEYGRTVETLEVTL